MTKQFLICRTDTTDGKFLNSQYFPRIVYARTAGEALRQAFFPEEYRPAGRRDYLVVPLDNAAVVTATPPSDEVYITVQPY